MWIYLMWIYKKQDKRLKENIIFHLRQIPVILFLIIIVVHLLHQVQPTYKYIKMLKCTSPSSSTIYIEVHKYFKMYISFIKYNLQVYKVVKCTIPSLTYYTKKKKIIHNFTWRKHVTNKNFISLPHILETFLPQILEKDLKPVRP